MAFKIEKATREQLPVKVLVGGPSGSGKTYTALLLATGITKASGGGKIAMINTEGPRGKLYADEFEYDIINLETPRSPEKYIEAINYLVSEGYRVIIPDSLSHEWTFLNEENNKMGGNSFNNWGKLKPRHQKLVDTIVECPVHIIATGRGKDEYVMETNDKGKQQPKKIGVGVQQEKDTEYEFIVTFNLAQDTHVATVMKDNTHLFEGRYDVLTEKDGEALYHWANSGAENPQPLQQQIIALAKSLGGSADKAVKTIVEEGTGCLRPVDCADINKLKATINALESLKQERSIK